MTLPVDIAGGRVVTLGMMIMLTYLSSNWTLFPICLLRRKNVAIIVSLHVDEYVILDKMLKLFV
jgi:hypothetical protein